MMIIGKGRAPGKVILFGEHAVVYGRPALAAPVTQVAAEAVVAQGPRGAGLTVWAEDLGRQVAVRDASPDDPLAAAARLTLAHLGLAEPDWRVTVRSTIPIASGMGSGAAVSAALIRALADAWSHVPTELNAQYLIPNPPFSPAELSALVYEVEKLHHGAPSGVDNTVIAYEQPVYFVRGQPPQPFAIGRPFMLAIADSGIASPTRITVGEVRRAWEQAPARFEALFDRIAAIVEAARSAIAAGEPEDLGSLMDQNHALLQEIGVSCAELDALATAARAAGALGAKLSGGGRGGNLIALVGPKTMDPVVTALRKAGALSVITTQVGA